MKLRKKMYFAFSIILAIGTLLSHSVITSKMIQISDSDAILLNGYLMTIAVVYLGLVLSLLEYYVFYRLKFINKRLKDIQSGDYTSKKRLVDMSENDEISEMAHQINKVIEDAENQKEELDKKSILYDSIVEDTPLLVQRFLPDGTITFVNDSYINIYGKEKGELIGKNIFNHVDSVGGNSNMLKKNLMSLSPCRPSAPCFYDTPIVLSGSLPKWAMWNNRAIFNKTGAIQEYQMVGMDIYNQKENQSKLKDALDNILSVIYFADKDGQLKYVSPSNQTVFGITTTEMTGRSIFDYIYKEDHQEFKKQFEKCIQNKESIIKEFRIDTNKEKLIWVQTTMDAVLDSYNEVVNIIVNMRDISEVKEAQDQVVIALNRMKSILEKVNTLEFIIDKSHVIAFSWKDGENINYVSKNISVLGYKDSDFLEGKLNFIDIVFEEDTQKFKNKNDSEIKEYRIIDANGKIFSVKDKTFITKNEEGIVNYYKGIELLPNCNAKIKD